MRFLLLLIITVIFLNTAQALDFTIDTPSKSIDFNFDSPKGDRGWSNPYEKEFYISVTNQLNTSKTVSLSTYSDNSNYLSLRSSMSSLIIPPKDSISVKITVQVTDQAGDGGTYAGYVVLTSGSQTEYANIYVKTLWPPPTLSISGDLDFGEVTAGRLYSRSFAIKEMMKYKNAGNVVLRVNEETPIYGSTIYPSSFNEIDTYGKTTTLSFTVKDRGLVPGQYMPTISISSSNNAILIGGGLRYSIPKPILEVTEPQKESFFNYGKIETVNQKLVISEIGGKTPLEGTAISFNKMNKEYNGKKEDYKKGTAWFTFPPQVEYIPPAGSKTVDINVNPADSPIGRYVLEGNVKSKYSGDKAFIFTFLIMHPESDEIRTKLIDLGANSLVIKYPQAESLRKTTESLFIRDSSLMTDTLNVISLTNVVIKFLNSMNAVYIQFQAKRYDMAFEEFKISKDEIDELNKIELNKIYSNENIDIKKSATDVWKEFALLTINGIENTANNLEDPSNPDASYIEAKKFHQEIGDICLWLSDTSCVQAHNNKVMDIDNKIKELIKETNDLENEIDGLYNDIHYNIFSGTILIKNPLKIQYLLDKYGKIKDNYDTISKNYRLIGEQTKFEKAQDKLTDLDKEYNSFKISNIVYIIFLVIIMVFSIWKSTEGFMKFRADGKDMLLGEIARMKKSE